MSTKKKLLLGAAGSAAAGEALDVDEVFSTYLYEGNNTFGPHTITNGIDLSGEGGLVWIKSRDSASSHGLYDTERGATKYLQSNAKSAEATLSLGLTSFNSNGFSVDYSHYADSHVSWTFRKAPKFFDVVSWTGTNATNNLNHNLGSVPGMIIIKNRTDASTSWIVWHRSLGGNDKGLKLETTTSTVTNTNYFANTAPTSTTFSVGAHNWTNGLNDQMIAYVFAHNNNDGEFGPDSDQDVIKFGSYTGNGSTDGPEINLGFEVQWVMVKRTDAANDWIILDVMRDFSTTGTKQLFANTSDSETGTDTGHRARPTSTGFKIVDSRGAVNNSSGTYIYMAIRRGPLAVPEDATKVFDVNNYSSNSNSTVFNTGFDVDMNINSEVTSGSARYNFARLIGSNYLNTDGTTVENGGPATVLSSQSNIIDLNAGWWGAQSNVISYSWRRAPGYFDVVAYTGTGSNRTVSHNLGVAPEMMWIKNRDASEDWIVYHKDVGATKYLMLSRTNAETTNSTRFNDTAPTASVFTVGTDQSVNSPSGHGHIAYLFATVAGVSKVGSYTGTGSTLNIDCGFSSGARFVLIKRTNDTNEWTLFDTVRGIVAGNDPYLYLSNTDAEVNAADFIDPYSAGFSLTGVSSLTNDNGDSYIFYAIA